jgi:predicted N-acyltransferase
MSFDIQVAHRVEEVGQAAWDQLAADRPFASYSWYRFGEAVLTDDEPTYIILSRGGEPLARATLWLTRQEPLPVPAGPVRSVAESVFRRWPLLICRSPLSNSSALILPPDSLRVEALTTLIDAASQCMKQQHASILLFDYLSPDETDLPAWPDRFVAAELSGVGTQLKIIWDDFGSYLKQLPKSMQKDYRRHHNRAVDLNISVKADSIAPPLDQVLQLIDNVLDHHHSRPLPWMQASLAHAETVDGQWLMAHQENRLVGCGLLIGDGGTAFLTGLGLDYNVQYVYFQLVYMAVRQAIENGTRILRGGSGAYEIKQRLGFQLENNNRTLYTTNSRLMNWLTRHLA